MHAEGLANDEYGAKQTRETDDEKVIPMFEEKHINVTGAVADDSSGRDASTSKKAKHRVRHDSNSKLRVTVPQPFSLEIDKRMSRGRRASSARFGAANGEERVPQESCGSLERKKPRPGLSKSVSLNHKNHPKREEHFSRARPKATLDRTSDSSVVSQPPPAVAQKPVRSKGRSVSMDLSSTQEKQVHKQRFLAAGSRNPKLPVGLPKSITLNHKSVSSFNAEECSKRTHQNPSQAINKTKPVSQVKATEQVDQKPIVTTCSKSGNVQQSRSIATSAKKTINGLLKNTRRVLGTTKASRN